MATFSHRIRSMDPKKVLQGLYTGLNIADAYLKTGQKASPEVGLSAFFDRRFSDVDAWKENIRSMVYCSREDYPSLNEREIVAFQSGPNRLKGYLYRAPISKGLIVYVHGLAGMADDLYAVGEDYFLRHGFDVFAIDLTASGASEGHGIPGLHQSALDVAAASSYIDSRVDLCGLPRYFFGHSWGGYGVAASLHFHPNVRVVVAVSAFDTPLKEMMAIPAGKLGISQAMPREGVEGPLRNRAGEYYDLSASESIAQSNIPVLLLHGERDTTVPLSLASLIDAADGPNVTKRYYPEKGHMDILYSNESVAYAKPVVEMSRELTTRYGRELSRIPKQERTRFASSFDKRMTSVANEEVFGLSTEFFAHH